MKIARIFGLVLALHVVGGILFIQPGCQSQPRPEASATAPALGQPTENLDWNNWESDDAFVATEGRQRTAPTRPAPGTASTGSTGSPGGETLRPLPSGLDPLTPIPSVSDRPQGGSYTVRAGDSLWTIATRNNVSLGALLSVNGLTEDSVIQPGQELRLPAGSSSTASTSSTPSSRPSNTTTYTVQSGDSLSVIARRHGTTVQDLKAMNNMTSDVIRIDQRLIVPEGGAQGARSQVTAAPRSTGATASNGRTHTVQAGETPGGIASRYGITANELMRANDISDPRRMRIGQTLTIPGGTGAGTTASQSGAEEAAPRPAPTPSSEPVRAPTPRDIPVLQADDDEEEEFPLIPILPADN